VISSVVVRQNASGTPLSPQDGIYDITLKSPAMLGAGSFTDSMEFEACFDAACTAPVPNSRRTVSVSLFIITDPTAFSRRLVPNVAGATDMVWSEANQSLYATVNSGTDHRIVQVDPVTMATTSSPPMEAGAAHQNVRHIAVSTDGSYLYAGSASNPYVYRLQLPSLALDEPVPLGMTGPLGSYPRLARDFAMIPGQPQSFVVSTSGANDGNAGVFVYDGLTRRPDILPIDPSQVLERPRWLVPSGAPGTFISQNLGPSFPQVNNFELLTVDATGIHVTGSVPTGHQFVFAKPRRVGNTLYLWNGQIIDATNGALLGTLPTSAGEIVDVLPVEARNRLFVWTLIQFKYYVQSYELSSMQLLGAAQVDFGSGSSQSSGTDQYMVAWGSEGIALSGGTIVLLSGPLFGG
jgi:hypothetical protein